MPPDMNPAERDAIIKYTRKWIIMQSYAIWKVLTAGTLFKRFIQCAVILTLNISEFCIFHKDKGSYKKMSDRGWQMKEHGA